MQILVQNSPTLPSSKKKSLQSPIKPPSSLQKLIRTPKPLMTAHEILETLKSSCKSSLQRKSLIEDKENKKPLESPNHEKKPLESLNLEEKPLASLNLEEKLSGSSTIKEKHIERSLKNEEKPSNIIEKQPSNLEEKLPTNIEEKKPSNIEEKPLNIEEKLNKEEKPIIEAKSNRTPLKSLPKVPLMYQKCGLCSNIMIIAKEKTRLLSCTHRFHDDCLGKGNKCFLCESQEAYDPRPTEKSLKKDLLIKK